MLNLLDKYNVRIIQTEDEIWFSAEDLGEVLELKNIREMVRGIEEEDKTKFNSSNVRDTDIRNFNSKLPNRGTTFLTEQGVYQIAFKSRKIEAMRFTKWVSNIIKQIRKNGYYILEDQANKEWFNTRKESKLVRRQETDQIKELVEYARLQGSENPEKYYISYTNLANKKIGIKSKERDNLSQEDLLELKSIETLIKRKIKQGIEKQLHYKEIYKHVKEFIDMV